MRPLSTFCPMWACVGYCACVAFIATSSVSAQNSLPVGTLVKANVESQPTLNWQQSGQTVSQVGFHGGGACDLGGDSRSTCDAMSCGCSQKLGNECFLFDDSLEKWFEFEFMTIWTKGQDVPTLLRSGNGLPPSSRLFGGETLNTNYFGGARITTGIWLNQQKTSAFVTRGFATTGIEEKYEAESDGTNSFAVPFTDDSSNFLNNGLPQGLALSAPGILQTGVPAFVRAASYLELSGGDAFIRKLCQQGCGYRIDWLAGAQFATIDDEVTLLTSTNRATPANTFMTFDKFQSDNSFLGGQLGMLMELDRGPMKLQLMGRVGLGNMNQTISISGVNAVNGVETGGGLFAQNQSATGGPAFNIGEYERDTFAWAPELTAKGIFNIRDNVDLAIGYTFMYWSDVALAGDQIDTRLNQDVFFDGPFIGGGGSGPGFQFAESDFYLHSLDIGIFMNY